MLSRSQNFSAPFDAVLNKIFFNFSKKLRQNFQFPDKSPGLNFLVSNCLRTSKFACYLTIYSSSFQEIRHPEELSLCKPLDYEHLKFNYSQVKREEERRRRVTLGALPSRGHSPLNSASTQDLDRLIVVDRPDTNTFISHQNTTTSNGYNTVTLGRKTSTLSWAGGSPRSRSFRSLGRNGTMSLLHTPSSSRRHINEYQHHNNGRSPTPHLNVSRVEFHSLGKLSTLHNDLISVGF